MLGVQGLGIALVVRGLQRLVEPDVAAVLHLAVGVCVLDDEDRLDRADAADLLVHRLLDRRGLALAPGAVHRHQRLRLGELHALRDGIRGEAPEDDVVRRADPGARKHRDDDLRNHRQIDPHHVAVADPPVLQGVREPLDVPMQVRVGDVALLALLAAPVERHLVSATCFHVAIEAVVRDVQLAALEPLVEGGIGVVKGRVRLVEPHQELIRLPCPECLEVPVGLLVQRPVADQGMLAKVFGRWEFLHVQERFELLLEALRAGRVYRHLTSLLFAVSLSGSGYPKALRGYLP